MSISVETNVFEFSLDEYSCFTISRITMVKSRLISLNFFSSVITTKIEFKLVAEYF